MAATFEKSVKGATKIKLAAPKAKYIEHILQATRTGEAGVGEIFRTLQFRLRDSTWTIAFKALIVVHLMITDGEPNAALQYISQSPQKVLSVNNYTDMQTQGSNIRRYSKYLMERGKAYALTKQDHVGGATGRMKRLSVDKGLLRETEIIQAQLHALVKCDFFTDDHENEISMTAFRILIKDILALFGVLNEAMINILEHYFEMSKPDAERALAVYKKFASGTSNVVKFLGVARQYESSTRVEIPTIKHAPTSLTTPLEDYLNDPDFEVHRRQYLAEREAKERGGGTVTRTPAFGASSRSTAKATAPAAAPAAATTTSKPGHTARGPSADLIDFFGSIESQQQPLGQPSQPFPQAQYAPQFAPQQTGMFQQVPYQPQMQAPSPFDQMQQQHQQQQQQSLSPQYTGAGFGGYTPQPQAQMPMQTGFAQQQQPQQSGFLQSQPTGTNPFRQSMMPTGQMPTPAGMQQPQQLTASQTGRNPFAHSAPQFQQSPAPPPMPQQQQQQQQLQPNQPAPLLAQATGTNPFARTPASPQSNQAPVLLSQATGSTNPFRQSQFVNQQTGQGWQQGPQFTMGGLEQLATQPVFPRPGQAPPQQQQQQQQSPWG